MIPTLLRPLAPVVGVAMAAILLYTAASRLRAAPPNARDVLALVEGPSTPAGPSAIVVFQIIDCSDTRNRLAGWSDAMTSPAGEEAAPVPVVAGVLVGSRPEDDSRTSEILAQAGLDFPVYHDLSGRVTGFVSALGYRGTPVALLFDAAGRLERAGPPRSFLAPNGSMGHGVAALDGRSSDARR